MKNVSVCHKSFQAIFKIAENKGCFHAVFPKILNLNEKQNLKREIYQLA